MRTSCPEVGRSQRPDLDATKRGTAAAVNQRQTAANPRERPASGTPDERWLTDDDGRATYAIALSLHPRKQQKRPNSAGWSDPATAGHPARSDPPTTASYLMPVANLGTESPVVTN